MDYKIVKNYRTDDTLRASFNNLVEQTFGFNFEDWYNNGYWNENYIPYSIITDGEIVANVSVNITDFNQNGKIHHYIQIGTVMTKENLRNQGLIRVLMNEIENDFADVDGMYLFANDEVVNFYPKFGFTKATESEYISEVDITANPTAQKIPMNGKSDWDFVKDIIDKSIPNSLFSMTNNSDLRMFYLSSFMSECVYRIDENTIAVAEIDGNELTIYEIFSSEIVNIMNIANAFGQNIKRVKLGFTPINKKGFACTEHREEDTTLFIKGNCLNNFSEQNLIFPPLSHA